MNLQVRSGDSEWGFTLIELLIVIAIIAILGATSTPFLSRFILQTNFDSTTDRIISAIRTAQNYAMTGKNNAVWGVCLTGNVVRIYSSSCTVPIIKEDFSIPQNVTVNNLTDTTFNRRGEPPTALTIGVATSLESLNIQLNLAGGVNIN